MAHTPSYDSAIEDILHKVGPKVLRELENTEAPTKSALSKTQRQGEVILKRVKAGENRSFGWLADGASTPTGRTVGFETYSLKGAIFYGKIQIDRGAAVQARGNSKSTADIVVSEIESAGKTAMRQLNHAIIHGSGSLGTLPAGASGVTPMGSLTTSVSATITSDLATEVRPGQTLDVYAGSGGNPTGAIMRRVYVTERSVNYDTGVHTFTILDSGEYSPTYTPASTDHFVLNGTLDETNATLAATGMTGLLDVTGSGSLFGISTSDVANWAGTRHDVGGSGLAAVNFRTLKTDLRNKGGNGAAKGFWLLNSNRLQETYEIEVGKIRFGDVKVMIGDYESMTSIVGDSVVVDESMPDGKVLYVNREDVKLACFKEMFQDGDGAPGKDKGSMHFQISQSALVYEAEMWGMYNLEVDARHRCGELYNI